MKKYALEIKWAFIFMGMGLVWMVSENLSGLHGPFIQYHPYLTNLIAIPAIAVYVYAIREKHQVYYHGNSTFRNRFVSGLIITLIVTLFSPLTQLITSYIITPHFFENAIRYTVENNLGTREDAEAFFNLGNYIKQGVVFAPVMGILTTLPVALLVGRKKTENTTA